jgi:hypothetical protein
MFDVFLRRLDAIIEGTRPVRLRHPVPGCAAHRARFGL